jgi:nucleotide-binding universal stress UspA family protein
MIPFSMYFDMLTNAFEALTWGTKILSKYNKIGLAISTKIITGSHSSRFIAYTIVKFAEDKGIDLIVVGSVGTGGISKNKSLGSVTRNIAEISTSPVLIVP